MPVVRFTSVMNAVARRHDPPTATSIASDVAYPVATDAMPNVTVTYVVAAKRWSYRSENMICLPFEPATIPRDLSIVHEMNGTIL